MSRRHPEGFNPATRYDQPNLLTGKVSKAILVIPCGVAEIIPPSFQFLSGRGQAGILLLRVLLPVLRDDGGSRQEQSDADEQSAVWSIIHRSVSTLEPVVNP